MCSAPPAMASSITSCNAGTSIIGKSSLGTALVTGKNRVPLPAAGITAKRAFTKSNLTRIRFNPCTPKNLRRPLLPTYVYKFIDSGETIEVYQAFTEDPLTQAPHPSDGSLRPVKKVFTPVGITFKGGGFYKTDSSKSASSTTPPGNTPSTESSKSETTKSEPTKSESSAAAPTPAPSTSKPTTPTPSTSKPSTSSD